MEILPAVFLLNNTNLAHNEVLLSFKEKNEIVKFESKWVELEKLHAWDQQSPKDKHSKFFFSHGVIASKLFILHI